MLFETDIEALPGYKSNEPLQLDAAGYAGKLPLFDPRDDDIPASFAVFTTSRSFAEDHPTAVADFLRATLHGFDWAEENPEEAVAPDPGPVRPQAFFTPEGETFRWTTEATPGAGHDPVGSAGGRRRPPSSLEAEVDSLVELPASSPRARPTWRPPTTRLRRGGTDEGKVVWFELSQTAG